MSSIWVDFAGQSSADAGHAPKATPKVNTPKVNTTASPAGRDLEIIASFSSAARDNGARGDKKEPEPIAEIPAQKAYLNLAGKYPIGEIDRLLRDDCRGLFRYF